MKRLSIVITIAIVFLSLSCGRSSPLDKLKSGLEVYDEYSIILADMKTEGYFSPSYYHSYKIVYAEKKKESDEYVYRNYTTDWYRVGKREYQKYYGYLGMTLLAKSKDGKVDTTPSPAGYRYVGNPTYGHWRTDSSGNSFWAFYGKYAFFSSIFSHTFNRPIYRTTYDTYHTTHTAGRPYYGPGNRYGTNGTATKQTHANFFQRQKAYAQAKKASFAQRVKNRTYRSSSRGYRSRSGGYGK
ncbi:MAG: hypothetical protein GTO45_33375 [Candidatus Aminicenantes bacterium]|nr:hypothetical protein [Candidatus Aminicenantes bacterium]NIM83624.1 hypothetical protein [Candidatus Aminicenantes bacterium]NIN23027.1 hypothetical protein [Candidatus Aminicenantes bacterium]NIN46763.1 hypothetical protein [Candidatus Aminicenantes bacterium]NIN89676.1 hypothetical protein [Candidatus Aminicenantes bacterium]